jgi:hypothetical protein
MFDEATELLPKAMHFLTRAVEVDEVPRYYFHGGTEAHRLATLAMCRWLAECKHDLDSLRKSIIWRELWFNEQRGVERVESQFVLPNYLDGEEYDALFRRFEASKLKAPTRLRNIHGQGTMSYVIARHRLGLEYTADEVAAAIETFLKRSVQEWLSVGQAATVAQWMKIAFWKPGDDPIATLLHSYDYLPGLEPPKYP